MTLIDSLYFLRSYSKVDFSKETKLQVASDSTTDSIIESTGTSSDSANFVTECFFLTMNCLHVGFGPIITSYISIIDELQEVQKLYKRLLEVSSQGAAVRVICSIG